MTVDGGKNWREAALEEPILDRCLTRFRYVWEWDGGPAKIASRALDSDKSGLSFAAHHTGRPLLMPDEVRNLPPSAELLFVAGQRPSFCKHHVFYA